MEKPERKVYTKLAIEEMKVSFFLNEIEIRC